MATIKLKFRASTVTGEPGRLYFQIIHRRITRQLPTDYSIFTSEWDVKKRLIVCSDTKRFVAVSEIKENVRQDYRRIARIVRQLENRGVAYAADEVINEFRRYKVETSFFNHIELIITNLKRNGRIRSSETYLSALRSFRRFRQGRDVMLDCIDSDMIEAYQSWMIGKGLVPNTRSFYNRILRAAYNRAVERGLIDDNRPFRKVYTGVEKTTKRALSISMLKKLAQFDLSDEPKLEYARDMFMMSFYLRGMSFIDMAYLKQTALRNGFVRYRRGKTDQLLTIQWEKEMQSILVKYPQNNSEYLLPIITHSVDDVRKVYLNKAAIINRSLKKIAAMLKFTMPLTMYVARHSWASTAKAKGVPISVICEGMGHGSESTTKIYLASLDSNIVDRANSLVIRSIR